MSGLPSRAWRLGELDLCRPHGIPFDRTTLPEDDDLTDLAAWLAGRFDSLAATPFDLGGLDTQLNTTVTARAASAVAIGERSQPTETTDSHGRRASRAGTDVHSQHGDDPSEGQGQVSEAWGGMAQAGGPHVSSAQGADSSAWHPNLTTEFCLRGGADRLADPAFTHDAGSATAEQP